MQNKYNEWNNQPKLCIAGTCPVPAIEIWIKHWTAWTKQKKSTHIHDTIATGVLERDEHKKKHKKELLGTPSTKHSPSTKQRICAYSATTTKNTVLFIS